MINKVRAGGEQVFAVVEDQEQLFIANVIRYSLRSFAYLSALCGKRPFSTQRTPGYVEIAENTLQFRTLQTSLCKA